MHQERSVMFSWCKPREHWFAGSFLFPTSSLSQFFSFFRVSIVRSGQYPGSQETRILSSSCSSLFYNFLLWKKKKRKKENPRNYCIMYNVCSVQGGSLLSLIDIARAVWNMWHKKKSRRLFTPSLCRGAASERLNATTVGDSRVDEDEEIPFHLFILCRLERDPSQSIRLRGPLNCVCDGHWEFVWMAVSFCAWRL